jgi:hypothetical protein
MERTQIFDLMSELKLFGMRSAYNDVMAAGIKRQHEPPQTQISLRSLRKLVCAAIFCKPKSPKSGRAQSNIR